MSIQANQINKLLISITFLMMIAHSVAISEVQAFDDIVVLRDAKLLTQPSLMYDAIYSPDAYRSFEKYTKIIDKVYGIDCDKDYSFEVIRLLVAAPIVISKETGVISEGIWFYRYSAQRCDQTKIYNIIAVKNPRTPGSEIKYKLFAPGTTEAGPRLVYDTLKLVYSSTQIKSTAIREKKKNNCAAQMQLFDTQYIAEHSSEWKENWKVKVCGELISSEITFTPDGHGGHHIAVK